MLRKISALVLTMLSLSLHAHEGGHGPKITSLGSHGGKQTAVISAKEAELGEKAKALWVAELASSVHLNAWSIHLSEAAGKSALKQLPFSKQIKIILVPKKPQKKAKVFEIQARDAAIRIPKPEDFSEWKGLELIFKNEKNGEKFVAAFPLTE